MGSRCADLPTLDAGKLLDKNDEETSALLQACKTHGFFYLNLASERTQFMLHAWDELLSFMKVYFDQDVAAKMLDARSSDITGYEPVGTSTGGLKDRVDHYESLKVSYSQCREARSDLTSEQAHNIEACYRFIRGSHEVTMAMITALSDALGITIPTPLEAFHNPFHPTTSTLAMFRYPQQTEQQAGVGVGHNLHTDLGTLTFLCCKQWGLQVLSPVTNSFEWVTPKADHAIINVGDSLRFLSGNQLLSAIHRVLPQQGYQREHRHSIAFFLRPADDIVYKDAKGRQVTARAWHDEKFNHFRDSHEAQQTDVIMFGGMPGASAFLYENAAAV